MQIPPNRRQVGSFVASDTIILSLWYRRNIVNTASVVIYGTAYNILSTVATPLVPVTDDFSNASVPQRYRLSTAR